jgi:hypothetical protein
MAKEGLIPVSYGFKKMLLEDLTYHMESKNVESEEFKEDLLTDLNYLCTFGLENPLRLHVNDDVSLIKYGKKNENDNNEGGAARKPRRQNMVNVRMVTGDHFETARYVAYKAGIISKIEMQGKDVVMTGE